MEIQQIIDTVLGFEGALVVQPTEDSGFPELAWGDTFFYYAPDGVMPERTQPYGTIITKNFPDDEQSRLDQAGRFRVNVQVERSQAQRLIEGDDPAEPDRFVAHPLYGAAGWLAVVNPATRTSDALVVLLLNAHDAAKARSTRRARLA